MFFFKFVSVVVVQEELELETSGGNGGLGSSGTSGGLTSATSMSHLGPPGSLGLDADSLRERQRWTRRWYLLVIVLLYIGLLVKHFDSSGEKKISFCLEIKGLHNRPPEWPKLNSIGIFEYDSIRFGSSMSPYL